MYKPIVNISNKFANVKQVSNKLKFNAICARQSENHIAFTFVASVLDIFRIARIERAGRDDKGGLFGFQRPQIARHILEIQDYLTQDDAVLPNPVVIAFVGGVQVRYLQDCLAEVEIAISDIPHGQIVDGQQRLAALQGLPTKDFQVFVSALVCESEEELRRQFILVNNTRPLPKELIYELLPSVSGLPYRMASRAFAAEVTTLLNYWGKNSETRQALFGEIKQHTNPTGSISSNAIQRVVMNSRSNGALREIAWGDDAFHKSVKLIADFYGAVMDLFPEAWIGMAPRTSRLKHSVGIIALGYVMEIAYALYDARTRTEFQATLRCLKAEGLCAWTTGTWVFGLEERRLWNQLQSTSPDIQMLSNYLVRLVRDQGIRPGSELDRARTFHIEHQVLLN